ncbi:MAG: Flp pilus assembly complex ATPase component TadA [Paenibacillaceae bacterium]|nr:Flp pilus assembly complex ATPase component TadA [Paenibacillaceae bacterium]
MATYVPFGTFLVQQGAITEDALKQLLEEQKKIRLRLGELILSKQLVAEVKLTELLAQYFGIPHVKLNNEKISPAVASTLPNRMLTQYMIVPYAIEDKTLRIAMSDPTNYHAIDEARIISGMHVVPAIASKSDIQRTLGRYFSGLQENVDLIMQEMKPEELTTQSIGEETSPMAKTVNQLILQAVQLKASDIHLEPRQESMYVRYRVDGIMRTEQQLPFTMHAMVVARIKIMASMNVSERRLPQDGRIKMVLGGHNIELRISTFPTSFGEKIVMRILGASEVRSGIDDLALSAHNLARVQRAINQPHGLVVVSGPTGSGKSTTLYAALSSLNKDMMNIVTIEDPIEQQIEGVSQSQVNAPIGYTFASGLRTILRQDPDVIMLGEIRDIETAEIAIRAAMTGHLVLTTLHTNSAVNSISRLVDMGVAPFLVASSIECIISQRLVRRVCPQCSAPHEATSVEKSLLTEHGLPITGLRKGVGCYECGMTGYKGRIGIHEVITVNEQLRSLIIQRATEEQCLAAAKHHGLHLMRYDGLIKVGQGRTTVDEVLRVT